MSQSTNIETCPNSVHEPPTSPRTHLLPMESADRATGGSNHLIPETTGVSNEASNAKGQTTPDSTSDPEPAPPVPNPNSPSDRNTESQRSLLSNVLQRLTLSKDGTDPPKSQTASIDQQHSASHYPFQRLRGSITHTRRPSELAVSSQKLDAVGHQHAPASIDPDQKVTEPVEVKPRAGRRNSSTKRARSLRPLSLLGLDESGDTLQDRLTDAVKTSSVGRHRKFIPESTLWELLTFENVELELKRCQQSLPRRLQIWRRPTTPDSHQQVARTIFGDGSHSSTTSNTATFLSKDNDVTFSKQYCKIFAILLLIDRPHRIRSFLKSGVCDEDLPLVKSCRDGGKLVRMRSYDSPLPCFQRWSASTTARFEEQQWVVLAPIFKRSEGQPVAHLELQPGAVLPFIAWDPVKTRSKFGQVYKTEIHSHHNFLNRNTEERKHVFAVKELFANPRVDIEKEVKIMRRLSCKEHSHPHLISLLATFKQRHTYFLIMPWAERDLLGYWELNAEGPKDKETALWLAEQCQGVAEALSKVHRWETPSPADLLHPDSIPALYSSSKIKEVIPSIQQTLSDNHTSVKKLFGRHGDIKPENILWFFNGGGRGILKITDFGIAHFSTKDSVPAKTRGPVANSPTYRAPESDLPNWMLSPTADIWALGCVFLEFVTWFFGGGKALNEFANSRLARDPAYANFKSDTFFSIEGHGITTRATVKDAVTQKINYLRAHPASSEFFRDLLHMVQRDMLQIDETYCENHRTGRKSSRKIAEELSGMVHKCRDEPGYYRDGLTLDDVNRPKRNSVIPKQVGFVASKTDHGAASRNFAPPSPVAQSSPIVPAGPSEPTLPRAPASPTELGSSSVPASPTEPVSHSVPASPVAPSSPIVSVRPSEPALPRVPASPTKSASSSVPASPTELVSHSVPASPITPASHIPPASSTLVQVEA